MHQGALCGTAPQVLCSEASKWHVCGGRIVRSTPIAHRRYRRPVTFLSGAQAFRRLIAAEVTNSIFEGGACFAPSRDELGLIVSIALDDPLLFLDLFSRSVISFCFSSALPMRSEISARLSSSRSRAVDSVSPSRRDLRQIHRSVALGNRMGFEYDPLDFCNSVSVRAHRERQTRGF